MHLIPYSIEEHEALIDVGQFMESYFDEAICAAACRACDKYGANWTCPPFDFDPATTLASYSKMQVVCSKVTLMPQAASPMDAADYPDYVNDTYSLVKLVVEDKLLARERSEQGALALFPGSCMRCPHGCKRAQGQPCVSPNTLRYSLEAFGGVLAPLVKDLFDLEFCWAAPGELPEYFLLVSAILHN